MTPQFISLLINAVAVISILAGLFGMLFCFPFLWSSSMADLVGAGFPFVAGSILFGSGIIALAVFNKKPNS